MSNHKKPILRLYIAGMTPKNEKVIAKFRDVLAQQTKEHYELEVIDIFERPELAEGEKIIATPTIVNGMPDPARKVILDFSSEEKLLLGMDVVLGEDKK